MGCYLSKPSGAKPFIDSVSDPQEDKAAELDQKHAEEAPNLIAAHVDTQQPRKVLPTQDSSQAKSDQFSVLRSDDVKPPVLNTQIYTELEGLPLAIHQPAPLPANEEERLAALKHLNVLDTAQEQRFDDITQLVCSIFSVPIAIVSLIDTERQWFKSCQGLLCNQTDRKSSFCAWTLVPKNPEVLVVPDATEDVRFQNNPLVLQDPFIRFYAGAPLVTQNGTRLGSLCIIDKQKRKFDAESCRLLANFAEVVVRELEKDEARRRAEQISGLQKTIEDRSEGVLLVDLAKPDWSILYNNEAWLRITGMAREEVLGGHMFHLFTPAGQSKDDLDSLLGIPEVFSSACTLQSAASDHGYRRMWKQAEQLLQEYQAAITKRLPFTLHLLRGRPTSVQTRRLVIAHFKPAATEQMSAGAPLVGIPGQVGWQDGQGGLLYFVTVQRDEDPNSRAAASPQGVAKDHNEAFEDVQLGPLLGQGGFGKVYRGLWNGAAVAVKIIQHSGPLPASEDGGGEQKPLLWKPKESRPSDDGSLLKNSRHSRNSRNKPQRMERNNVEGVLTLQLSHPNVVQTFKAATRPLQSYSIEGAEEEEEQLFETWLLLEFCDKGSLQDACDRGWFHTDSQGHIDARTKPNMKAIKATVLEIAAAMGRLHSQDLLHMVSYLADEFISLLLQGNRTGDCRATAQEIAGALAYLHSQDLLHGDLTGGNILLASSDADERGFAAKVADFGLSRTLGNESVDTGTYGTVTHMPPELLTTGCLSKSCDVYAFGVLLWEMYTGQRPWQGMGQMQIIFHLTQRKKRLQFTPGTPPKLEALGMQCMSTEPEARPKFAEILRRLDDIDIED